MKKFSIIVAGGVGQRLNNEIPKQFLLLKDKPVILHTLQRFVDAEPDISIVLALKETLYDRWFETVEKFHFNHPVTLSVGGEERFDTVKNALQFIPNHALVAIHDSVRPLVSVKTIQQAFQYAETEGSAIPAILPTESIRVGVDGNFISYNRNFVRLIQTPQTFVSNDIKKAYQSDFSPEFTDDATVYETLLKKKVFLFEGNRENIKITYPEDIAIATAFLP